MSARWLVLALLVTLVGCQPPPISIDFVTSTALPASTTLSSTEIQIPVGQAVAVHAQPMQSGQEMSSSTALSFSFGSDGVLGINPSTQGNFSYVLYGISPGTTTMTWTVSGSSQGRIAVTVTAPLTD